MPERAQKIRRRRDDVADAVEALEAEADDLDAEAEQAVRAGDLDEADRLRSEAADARDRAERKRRDLNTLDAQLRDAERREAATAATDRVQELADVARTARDDAVDDAADVVDHLREALDRAEDAWSAVDEIRRAGAEVDLLADLYGLDAPDDLPSAADVVEDLDGMREALTEGRRRLETLTGNRPRDPGANPSQAMMLERRLRDLDRGDPGTGRVYGRVKGVPGLLSEDTRDVADAALRARLRDLYDQIHDNRKSNYRAPGEDTA